MSQALWQIITDTLGMVGGLLMIYIAWRMMRWAWHMQREHGIGSDRRKRNA
jgi:hypothetical protein